MKIPVTKGDNAGDQFEYKHTFNKSDRGGFEAVLVGDWHRVEVYGSRGGGWCIDGKGY